MLTRLTCCLSLVILLSAFFLPPPGRPISIRPHSPATGEKAPQGAIWLESLDLSKIEQGWGQPNKGRSVDGNPLKIHGQHFQHGVGTHAVSEMHVDLHGAAEQFVSMVGVDDETGKGSVTFEVLVDGKKVAESGPMKGGDAPSGCKPICTAPNAWLCSSAIATTVLTSTTPIGPAPCWC